MSRFAAALLALPVLVPCSLAAALPAQEAQAKKAAPTIDERIERYLKHARTGSAYVRPQAARKLTELGEPAAQRLLGLAQGTHAQIALLGADLVETFGKFGDTPSGAKLRAKLWPLLEDANFPWRPGVARGIVADPKDGEFDRLARYIDDPIAPVRFAIIDGLYTLTRDPKTDEDRERARRFLDLSASRLVDENDVVRREAAMQLHARGHAFGLLWLLEDLKRVDTFFDMPNGEAARYAAMSALADRGVDLANYEPEQSPTSEANVGELAKIEAEIRALGKASRTKLPEELRTLVPDQIPAIAKAVPKLENAVVGIQLKSCRKGDYHLRWTEDDVLVVGYGNPARIQLATGTTAALVEIANRTQKAVGEKVYWGQRGCDLEGFHMPRLGNPDGRPQLLMISKNEGPIEDLRPGALTELGTALAATIPPPDEIEGNDPRTRDLARRVRSAFASIGGKLREPGASAGGN